MQLYKLYMMCRRCLIVKRELYDTVGNICNHTRHLKAKFYFKQQISEKKTGPRNFTLRYQYFESWNVNWIWIVSKLCSLIYRGYFTFLRWIPNIFISSNVLKISVISRWRSTSEIADIFSTWDEIVLVFTEKKFFLFFSVKGKTELFS